MRSQWVTGEAPGRVGAALAKALLLAIALSAIACGGMPSELYSEESLADGGLGGWEPQPSSTTEGGQLPALSGAPEEGGTLPAPLATGDLLLARVNATLRMTPEPHGEVLSTLAAGTVAVVVRAAPESGYLELRQAGRTGWSYGGHFVRAPLVRALETVNLRSGAGTEHPVVTTAAPGERAVLLETLPSGWLRVLFEERQSFTAGLYWEPVPEGGTSQQEPSLVVNGHRVSAREERWIRHIASQVLPRLAGTRDERLEGASVVTWWSLKEGVLSLENPLAYSNCSTSSGDLHVGPLYVCGAGRAWQVGLAATQVTWNDQAEVEATALALHPGLSLQQILKLTAEAAGYAAGAEHDAIVASTGSLRRSWLLRNSVTGFTLEAPTITRECVVNSYAWCYGRGWDTSAAYAPSRAAAMGAIADLRRILDALAP